MDIVTSNCEICMGELMLLECSDYSCTGIDMKCGWWGKEFVHNFWWQNVFKNWEETEEYREWYVYHVHEHSDVGPERV